MVVRKVLKQKSGFIVHPWETSDNKYHASYGNHNRTVKSFKTLKNAKSYLKRNKISEALYDSPSGNRKIVLSKIKKRYR